MGFNKHFQKVLIKIWYQNQSRPQYYIVGHWLTQQQGPIYLRKFRLEEKTPQFHTTICSSGNSSSTNVVLCTSFVKYFKWFERRVVGCQKCVRGFDWIIMTRESNLDLSQKSLTKINHHICILQALQKASSWKQIKVFIWKYELDFFDRHSAGSWWRTPLLWLHSLW